MAQVTFREERCKGCALCTTFCPPNIVTLDKSRFNKKGFHPAIITEMEKCKGCAFCARMCPDLVIEVKK
ncbi:4Fe-4S dicluster domain-containing protein [Heliorestis convoluta]|uniref:4Fe-4S dicluster domain-containing protein n=1 Tax=Heliorestis convoluta TaxID=356322 RepID=A0A5Q2NAI7_9FIRM|nr:4Fe-4S dicluster domain-containing protein [Heliorestis convoluta]QGG49280.1 4Fe-4S dicluster domain-containing protein [Heliorestis convoluta]